MHHARRVAGGHDFEQFKRDDGGGAFGEGRVAACREVGFEVAAIHKPQHDVRPLLILKHGFQRAHVAAPCDAGHEVDLALQPLQRGQGVDRFGGCGGTPLLHDLDGDARF